MYGYPITKQAHIHSLDGGLADATILEKTGDNQYLAEYNGARCTAILNPFTGQFYVDDTYGLVVDDPRGNS
jgi:hypothetical protein